MTEPSLEIILSAASFGITVYFWLVQARRERPNLVIHQISNFRTHSRRHPEQEDLRRLSIQHLDSCGVLIANNSTRQNSIILFDCWLFLPDGRSIRGDWGFVGEDRPPWNIGPESTISMGLACFFDVPADFELDDSWMLGVDFITASGKRFEHTFTKDAPPHITASDVRAAA